MRSVYQPFRFVAQTIIEKFMKTLAYAAQSATTPLIPFDFQRRDLGKHDVQIEILYCGVCHSDVHTARNEGIIRHTLCTRP